MKIDLQKYDRITKLENEIEKLLPQINENPQYLVINKYTGKGHEQQILYILTIMTILYKEKHHMMYAAQKSKKINQQLTEELLINIKIINNIINKINEPLNKKKIFESLATIISYADIIEQVLEQYYEKKRLNYIEAKIPLEIICSEGNYKNLIRLNPFIINQIIGYNEEKLTTEEKIISEIIEYHRIALERLIDEDLTDEKYEEELIKQVKIQIIKNHNEKELSKVILFMISNSYQEIMDHPEDTAHQMIKAIIENNNIENEELVKMFMQNDIFSTVIIVNFFEYNIKIKRGRLEELKQKPSYQYAVKRYK